MCVQELGITLSVEDAARCMDFFDRNKDGFVTLSEVISTVDILRSPSRLSKAFLRFDANGDGRIGQEELASMLQYLGLRLSSPLLRLVMQAMDSNEDGGMDMQEVEAFLGRREKAVLRRFSGDT